MEFKVKRSDILKSLTILSTVTGKASYVPVLSNILIEVDDKNKLVLKGTDSEISIVIEHELEQIISEGSCTVPAKEITDLFRNFDENEEIHLKLEEEHNILNVKSRTGKYNLAAYPKDVFPEIPEYKGSYVKLPAQPFKEMIIKTSASVRAEYIEFNLFGAKLFFKENKMVMVSTDAFRLSYVEYEGDEDFGLENVFIPKRAMSELQSFIGSSEVLEFNFDDKHLYFKCDNRFMVSQKTEGGFPNYESIIPKSCPLKCTIDVKRIKSALGRVSIFTNKISNHIFMKFVGDKAILDSGESEKGVGIEEFPIEDYSGEEKVLKLNSSYLKEYFSVVKVDKVTACLPTDEKKPLMLVSKEGGVLYKFVLVLL